jgi:hypothetical protein
MELIARVKTLEEKWSPSDPEWPMRLTRRLHAIATAEGSDAYVHPALPSRALAIAMDMFQFFDGSDAQQRFRAIEDTIRRIGNLQSILDRETPRLLSLLPSAWRTGVRQSTLQSLQDSALALLGYVTQRDRLEAQLRDELLMWAVEAKVDIVLPTQEEDDEISVEFSNEVVDPVVERMPDPTDTNAYRRWFKSNLYDVMLKQADAEYKSRLAKPEFPGITMRTGGVSTKFETSTQLEPAATKAPLLLAAAGAVALGATLFGVHRAGITRPIFMAGRDLSERLAEEFRRLQAQLMSSASYYLAEASQWLLPEAGQTLPRQLHAINAKIQQAHLQLYTAETSGGNITEIRNQLKELVATKQEIIHALEDEQRKLSHRLGIAAMESHTAQGIGKAVVDKLQEESRRALAAQKAELDKLMESVRSKQTTAPSVALERQLEDARTQLDSLQAKLQEREKEVQQWYNSSMYWQHRLDDVQQQAQNYSITFDMGHQLPPFRLTPNSEFLDAAMKANAPVLKEVAVLLTGAALQKLEAYARTLAEKFQQLADSSGETPLLGAKEEAATANVLTSLGTTQVVTEVAELASAPAAWPTALQIGLTTVAFGADRFRRHRGFLEATCAEEMMQQQRESTSVDDIQESMLRAAWTARLGRWSREKKEPAFMETIRALTERLELKKPKPPTATPAKPSVWRSVLARVLTRCRRPAGHPSRDAGMPMNAFNGLCFRFLSKFHTSPAALLQNVIMLASVLGHSPDLADVNTTSLLLIVSWMPAIAAVTELVYRTLWHHQPTVDEHRVVNLTVAQCLLMLNWALPVMDVSTAAQTTILPVAVHVIMTFRDVAPTYQTELLALPPLQVTARTHALVAQLATKTTTVLGSKEGTQLLDAYRRQVDLEKPSFPGPKAEDAAEDEWEKVLDGLRDNA